MKKITAFKLSDGRIIENETVAKQKQKELDFINAINVLVCDKIAYHTNQEVTIDFILENKEELKKILENA